ncbi:hypothetical protein MKK68_10025 [Methylobacterium sp. E-016]|nr:hypothetical protein [Methylobacterium sp. E-016]MCJ2075991.1 hypothetical protein [Methylobacterium sp. E-016]
MREFSWWLVAFVMINFGWAGLYGMAVVAMPIPIVNIFPVLQGGEDVKGR